MASRQTSPFEWLPGEIVLEIFSKLPAMAIARARAVCKSWNLALSRPEFQETSNSRYLFAEPRKSTIYLMEDDGHVSKIKTAGRDGCHHVVSSSGELICHYSMKTQNEPLYICNPTLEEHVKLPESDLPSSSCSEFVAFGYDNSTGGGDRLKVVRLSCFCHKSIRSGHFFLAEIHTLGTSSWRVVGSTPKVPVGRGVYCGGSIHWKTRTGVNPPPPRESIMAVDLRTEVFRVEVGPEVGIKVGDTRYIVALGEDLCFVVSSRAKMGVWVKMEVGLWCKRYSFDTEQWWGSMEGPRFEVVGRLKDGALLGLTGKGVGSYDPRTQVLRKMDLPPEVEGVYVVYSLRGDHLISPNKLISR